MSLSNGLTRHTVVKSISPGISDVELLQRFREQKCEQAFTELVRRHGPVVLGAALRVVGDPHTAEDVYQATFLTLARDARKIRRAESIVSWLHGVALRLGKKSLRRRHRFRSGQIKMEPAARHTLGEIESAFDQQVLDEELQNLPPQFRDPLVLHFLKGLSYEETARALNTTVGAIEGRLKRGKRELQLRLARRGVGLALAISAIGWSRVMAETLISPQLTQAAAGAGMSLCQGTPYLPNCSPEAVHLVTGEAVMLTTGKLAAIATAVMLAAATGWVGARSAQSGEVPGGTNLGSTEVQGESETDPATQLGTALAFADEPDTFDSGSESTPLDADTSLVPPSEPEVVTSLAPPAEPVEEPSQPEEVPTVVVPIDQPVPITTIIPPRPDLESGVKTIPQVEQSPSTEATATTSESSTEEAADERSIEDILNQQLESISEYGTIQGTLIELERRYGLRFQFDRDELFNSGINPDEGNLYIHGRRLTFAQALKEGLDRARLHFIVEGDHIVVKAGSSGQVTGPQIAQEPQGPGRNSGILNPEGDKSDSQDLNEKLYSLVDWNLENASLGGLVKRLQSDHGIQAAIDYERLQESGVNPYRMRLNATAEQVSLHDALQQALEPLGLVARIRDSHLWLTLPGRIAVITDHSPREREIFKKLNQELGVQLTGNPLREVVDYLADTLEIPILLDEIGLRNSGFTGEEEIDLQINQPMTARNILNLILRNVGGEQLDYYVDNDVLTVTSHQIADMQQETRIYDVRPIVSNYYAHPLLQMLTEQTSIRSRQDEGEIDGISYYRGSLVVRASQHQHEEVEALLNQLAEQIEAHPEFEEESVSPGSPPETYPQGGAGGSGGGFF